jgi:hypothetical protein
MITACCDGGVSPISQGCYICGMVKPAKSLCIGKVSKWVWVNLEKLAKVRSEETPRSSRTVAYVQLRRCISGIIDY